MRRRVLAGCLSGALLAASLFASAATSAPVVDEKALFDKPTSATELARITRTSARALERAKVVRGQFTQLRHLAGLARPLKSAGGFVFARGAGIEWHTREPFDSQFLLGHTGITQRDEGTVTLKISTAEEPAMQVVARVFMALFALDIGALENDFELYGLERPGGAWVIGLRPRAEALGSVFQHAIVRGGTTVESVILKDGNGDRSEIALSAVVYDPADLTTDERKRFSSAP